MMNSIEIKKANTMVEIEAISTVAKVIWEDHFIPLIGEEQVEYMLTKFLSTLAIEKAIKDGYEFYGMFTDKIIGFIAIKAEKDTMFLSKLYVMKSERGKGYARYALDFIEACTKKDKLESIWLTCNKYNKKTLAIYDKMGFTIFEEAINDIGNNYVMDDYYLRKTL